MKIKCIKKLNKERDWFTVGKIYEVENDHKLKDDGGYIWNTITSIESVNKRFDDYYEFEFVSDTPITLEQFKNLKSGDKVRLGDGKYSHWVSAMEKYRNQVVTIRRIIGSSFKIVGEDWTFLLQREREKDGKLESDIVEIISDEKPTPTETIPKKKNEKKEEPTVEQFTPESFKEVVINFISKLPYKGGTVSFAICEAERARIIEGIRELDIT